MKYAIWRHENSIGNSGEHTIGLYKHLLRTKDDNPIIYVEHDFQREFALCIPGIAPANIRYFDEKNCKLDSVHTDEYSNNIYMPSVYREKMSYPASWADLTASPECTLTFPHEHYENKKLPKNTIVMHVREKNTFHKRVVGANEEPERFVNPQTFFEIAEYYANKGIQVVRVGDKNQTPFPKHHNILDFALEEDRTILDDLYLISESRAFISCDSGIWPLAAGMKKNLVLSNITSIFYPMQLFMQNGKKHLMVQKSAVIDWLPKETTTLLMKKVHINEKNQIYLEDNTAEEIIEATKRFL